MFPNTLTPHVVSTEATIFEGSVWRMVEAQHYTSTMKLVDDPDDHDLLEQLLDDSKPAIPTALSGFHYLLATPFRYPPRRGGTRFRAQADPGVFYGAGSLRTSCAELGYWRWRFLMAAPEVNAIDPVSHTAFATKVKASAIDLRHGNMAEYRSLWMHPQDYAHTQQLSRVVRQSGVQSILYTSVRDPNNGWCLALLDPRGFAAKAPKTATQTWNLTVTRDSVYWRRDKNEHFLFQIDQLKGIGQ